MRRSVGDPVASRCKRRLWRRCIFAASLCLLGLAGCQPAATPRPPNVVMLLADDLGWNDVGYHGGAIPTPRIDALAGESLRLERFYVSPWCAPSRAGLLTGRDPSRMGLSQVVAGLPAGVPSIGASERLLPELLAPRGYATRALIGKWGLGMLEEERPLDQGFTSFYGSLGSMVGYLDRSRFGEADWYRGESPVSEEGYTTALLAEEAVAFLDAEPPAPFLLVVSFTAPHLPLAASAEDLAAVGADPALARLSDKIWHGRGGDVQENAALYAAMVFALDSAIGRILDALERGGLGDDTIVFFASDNGAVGAQGIGDNHPLAGGKNELLEGGIRVPAVVRWPGVIGAGEYDAPVSYLDIVPTLLRAAGEDPGEVASFDGLNLLDAWSGFAAPPERTLFYAADVGIRGAWKLRAGGLYDVVADPGESSDRAASHPQLVAELAAELEQIARARRPEKPEASSPRPENSPSE